MSSKYKVVVVGMGKRGMHHAQAFQANGRFEVVGVCDVDRARLDAAAAKVGAAKGSDALQAALETKRDVFCFCTLPNLRSEMIHAGIRSGARLIAFEKPVALNKREGFAVRKLLSESGIKAVVSHQHRYGERYRKVKEIIDCGTLGHVHSPDRLHALVQRRVTGTMGAGASRRMPETRRPASFTRLHWRVHPVR